MLKVPLDLAGFGVQRQCRICIEDIAISAAALHRAPRDRHADADVDQAELGVVARRHPCGAAAPVFLAHVAPAVVTEFSGAWDRASAPDFLSRLRVVSRYPTAGVDVVTTGHACDYAPLDDLRASRVMLADRPVSDALFPNDFARTCIESDEIRIVRCNEQLVSVQHAVAIRTS